MIKAIRRLSSLMIFKVVDNIVLRVSQEKHLRGGRGGFVFLFSPHHLRSHLAGDKGIVRGQRKS